MVEDERHRRSHAAAGQPDVLLAVLLRRRRPVHVIGLEIIVGLQVSHQRLPLPLRRRLIDLDVEEVPQQIPLERAFHGIGIHQKQFAVPGDQRIVGEERAPRVLADHHDFGIGVELSHGSHEAGPPSGDTLRPEAGRFVPEPLLRGIAYQIDSLEAMALGNVG